MKVSSIYFGGLKLACVSACIFSVLQARAEADKVTLVRAREVVVGKITKDDRDGLEIEIRDRSGAAKRTFNSNEVAEIEWDVSEEGFHEGGAAFHNGSFERAADLFGGIANQPDAMNRVRAIARPYVLYMHAESLFRAGKAADAYTAYQKLIEGAKNSRYAPFALSNMADAAIQAKTFDKVPALLAQLREGGPEQKQLADYYEAEALLAQGKAKEAATKYMNAVAGGPGRIRAMALVGQARAQAASGDSVKARELAQQALTLNPPDLTAARAHVIIGDAALSDADSKKLSGTQLQDALLDAILSYLRVQNQYPADSATEGYALLKIGECFKRLSKLPSRAASDDRERAMSAFGRIASERRFANSDLPNLASKHMEEMK